MRKYNIKSTERIFNQNSGSNIAGVDISNISYFNISIFHILTFKTLKMIENEFHSQQKINLNLFSISHGYEGFNRS